MYVYIYTMIVYVTDTTKLGTYPSRPFASPPGIRLWTPGAISQMAEIERCPPSPDGASTMPAANHQNGEIWRFNYGITINDGLKSGTFLK